eukprot:624184-Pleurochrysis_carterae.AAC.3
MRRVTSWCQGYPFPIRGRGGSCGSHPFVPSCVGRCLCCSRRLRRPLPSCMQARLRFRQNQDF